jgi:hypothetical protein
MHKHRSAEDILVGARLAILRRSSSPSVPVLGMALLAAVHPRSHAASRPPTWVERLPRPSGPVATLRISCSVGINSLV